MPNKFTLLTIYFCLLFFNKCFVYLPLIVYCGPRVNLQVFIWPLEQFELETPTLAYCRANNGIVESKQVKT